VKNDKISAVAGIERRTSDISFTTQYMTGSILAKIDIHVFTPESSLASQPLYPTRGKKRVWEKCLSQLVLPSQHVYWRVMTPERVTVL